MSDNLNMNKNRQDSSNITHAVLIYTLSLALPFLALFANWDLFRNSLFWYFLWPFNYLYYIQFNNANAPQSEIDSFIRSMGIFGVCSIFYVIARVRIQARYVSIETSDFMSIVKGMGFGLFFYSLGYNNDTYALSRNRDDRFQRNFFTSIHCAEYCLRIGIF